MKKQKSNKHKGGLSIKYNESIKKEQNLDEQDTGIIFLIISEHNQRLQGWSE